MSSSTARTLVDVSGYRLAIDVSVRGSPPVVCLSCLCGSHSEWVDVVALLKDVTTCVTCGRPAGGSDPLPAAAPLTAGPTTDFGALFDRFHRERFPAGDLAVLRRG